MRRYSAASTTAGAAHRRGHTRAGQAAAAFGIAVAGVSWAQLALGIWLFGGLVPDGRAATAGAVYHGITRMDGAKMFLLAAMAVTIAQAARRPHILPAWLAPAGVVLAAALVTSGLGYLLLVPDLASAVYLSGILLLIFVSATGITLRLPDTPATAMDPDMLADTVTPSAGNRPPRKIPP